MFVNGLDDRFDPHGVDGLLEFILPPEDLVLRPLPFDGVAVVVGFESGCGGGWFGQDVGLGHVGVADDRLVFFDAERELEVPVPAAPLGGFESGADLGDLLRH